jgi:N-acetylglucosamine kinase
MSTILGIDAGGTKTVAATVDVTGAVLDLATAPGLDPTRAIDAAAELGAFLRGLVRDDAIAPAAATVGLPFHGEVAAITAMQHEVVRERLGLNARACNDVEVAHVGAFGGGHGVLLLAGTGSMAWATGPGGTARAGGFGDLIGDEGSAFWIGQRALALVSREADGRRSASPFGQDILQALGIGSDGLIDWIYAQANTRSGIASVGRHVSASAAGGNMDATSILKRAAAELAEIARAAAEACGLRDSCPISTAGGVFRDPVVRTEVARLTGREPSAGLLPPVGGALLDAAHRAGWSVDRSWMTRLGAELMERGAA